MSKSMKGFTVGPMAPSKKCGVDYDGKTKLEKLEKKKLKLEKKIEKQMKKKDKKKCGTVTNIMVQPEVVVVADEVVPTTLAAAMTKAKEEKRQEAASQ